MIDLFVGQYLDGLIVDFPCGLNLIVCWTGCKKIVPFFRAHH